MFSHNTNDSTICEEEIQHWSIITLLCLVFFLGFLLNVFSLWVFCRRMPCWTSGTTLQFHLALSDAIATPVTPLMAWYFAKGNEWTFGPFMCQLKIALLSMHFYGSTMFLTLISVHRYMAVVKFNRNSRLRQKRFIMWLCLGIWAMLLVQAIIYAFLLRPRNVKGQNHCLSIHQRNLTDAYFVINFMLFIFCFLIPFAVSAFCYGRVANTLTRLNISSAQGLKVKKKSQRMIGMCLVIFGLCFLPLNVVRTVAVVLKKYYPMECDTLIQMERAYYTSLILAGVNSILDPLLYCFSSQHFRDVFQSFRRTSQEEDQNEGDSETIANQ